MSEIVLTNDKQRKEFLKNYNDRDLGWSINWYDPVNMFTYYRCEFHDGSFITVLEGRRSPTVPIKTLTLPGEVYFPAWTNQGDLIKHLKKVAGKER